MLEPQPGGRRYSGGSASEPEESKGTRAGSRLTSGYQVGACTFLTLGSKAQTMTEYPMPQAATLGGHFTEKRYPEQSSIRCLNCFSLASLPNPIGTTQSSPVFLLNLQVLAPQHKNIHFISPHGTAQHAQRRSDRPLATPPRACGPHRHRLQSHSHRQLRLLHLECVPVPRARRRNGRSRAQ